MNEGEERRGKGKNPSTEMDGKSGVYFLSAALLLQLLQTYSEENKMLFKIT